MVAFPVFKLAVLAAKQISRPIANRLKQRAKDKSFFRRYICIPTGQLYHLWDTRLKLKLLGLATPTTIKQLTDENAAEMGAGILGELIMFGFGTGLLILEYRRQSKNDAEKERKARAVIDSLYNSIDHLEDNLAVQSELINELANRLEKKR